MEKKVLKYTSLTPEDCYDLCYKTTMENILKYDGRVTGENVIINYRKPDILPLELAYPGIIVKEVNEIKKPLNEVNSIEFEGSGIAIVGPDRAIKIHEKITGGEFVAEIEVKIDGERVAIRKIPFSFKKRATELYLNFDLPDGNHTIELNWLNQIDDVELAIGTYIVFTQ